MNEGTSLVKYMNQTDGGNGQNLYWHRASQDGAPFRGPTAPVLKEEEYQQQVVRIGDPQVEIFDTTDPEQRKKYQEVLAKVVNGGWGQVLFIERKFIPELKGWRVYLEWVQWFMQDGSQEAAQQLIGAGPTDEQHQPPPYPVLPSLPIPSVPGPD